MLQLSKRQEEFLKLKVNGKKNKEIGWEKGISTQWVEQTFNDIFKILELRFGPRDNREERKKRIEAAANDYFRKKGKNELLT